MEKSRPTGSPTIILRYRNPPQSCRNKPQIIRQYYGDDVEITNEGQCFKFKKGIPEWSTNYESYDKVFGGMVEAMHAGQDQVYFFGGDDEERLQTYLGNQTDPGFMPIAMIYLLQEKYRAGHECMTVRVAFLEYQSGNFFDLLSPAKTPLRIVGRAGWRQLQGHCWVKLGEYIQFLRLLKVALFNNRHRDFRAASSPPIQRGESIFMMRVHIQLKDASKASTLQSVINLIDIQEDPRREKSNVKTQWDHLCQSLKCLRKDGQVKVEKNTCWHEIEPGLNSGVVKLVYCMSSVKDKYVGNLQRLTQLKQIMQHKPAHSRSLKLTSPKTLASSQGVKQQIQEIQQKLSKLQYASYRHLYQMEAVVCRAIDRIVQRVNQSQQIISQIIMIRARLELELRESVTELSELVGSCVKSQHIKDFYSSKTYGSLYREVAILTEGSSQSINKHLAQLYSLIGEYEQLIRKQSEFLRELTLEGTQDENTSLVLSGLVGLAKELLESINGIEAGQYRMKVGLWLQLILQKSHLEQQVKNDCSSILHLKQQVQNLPLGKCNFKQQRILASSNIISKVAARLDQTTKQHRKSLQQQDPNQLSLPRLMFRRVQPTTKPQQKKFTIKLSDFLFRINRQPAQQVLKVKPQHQA